jgi:hypothetical protein
MLERSFIVLIFLDSTTQNCKRDRWYCLYALIIREGDGPFGPVGVAQTSRTLLLRPEEVLFVFHVVKYNIKITVL